MSILLGGNQTPASQEQTQDYVKQLVDTKGAQWSDPQTVAKGKIEADGFIADLQTQIANLEGQVDKQDYTKTLLAKLEEGKVPQPTGDQGQENTTPTFDDEHIKSLIQSTLTQTQHDNVKQSNLSKADEKLVEAFGTEAAAAVEKRSKELGLTKDKLTEIAGDSPDAFMSLMGQAPKKEASPMVPGARINTTADSFQGSNTRDWKFYNDLRKTDLKTYRSAAVQRQMMEDRKAQGSNFNT